MHKIHAIMTDERFIEKIKYIEEKEKTRIFCGHGYEHILSVARIAYILSLENNLCDDIIDKETIYAAALLHDIGRAQDLKNDSDHRMESAIIAEEILRDAGFSNESVEMICYAIRKHGVSTDKLEENYDKLAWLLYRADKKSRNCFICKASEECYWSEEKKTHFIDI